MSTLIETLTMEEMNMTLFLFVVKKNLAGVNK